MIVVNNQVFVKYAWITLLGCLFFFDVFCLLNSDFFQLKSIEVRFKNDNLTSISLFQNSYNKVIKPIIVGEEGLANLDNFQHYLILIKTNRAYKKQSSVLYQISGKSYSINLKFNKNQKDNEVKTCSDVFWFWIINENIHKLYGVNILIILFAFINYNWR